MAFVPPEKADKISAQIIDQIRDAILGGRFKLGDFLATEKELVNEFAVSKATVREALRVLEVMGLIEIKAGSSGGVFVADIDHKTTVHKLVNFLDLESTSIAQVTMMRYILEPAVARLAASKITAEDIVELKGIIEGSVAFPYAEHPREIGFHRYLPRLTQNPLLIMIMDFVDAIINKIKSNLELEAKFFEHVRRMHLEILRFLSEGDGEGAAEAIARDVLEVGNYLSDLTGTARFDPAVFGESRITLRDEIQECDP
jgi:GntR family transcriptional regulator, transcriptional repressor for pyruvate dehydrogenase complex